LKDAEENARLAQAQQAKLEADAKAHEAEIRIKTLNAGFNPADPVG